MHFSISCGVLFASYFISSCYGDLQSSAQQVIAPPKDRLVAEQLDIIPILQDLNQTTRFAKIPTLQRATESDEDDDFEDVVEAGPFDHLDDVFYRDGQRPEIYKNHRAAKDIHQEYMTAFGRTNFLLSQEPIIPAEINPEGWHIFVRLDTVPKTYPSIGSVSHAGINKLMFDLGGQHVDVVFGSPSKGWYDCGLALQDKNWTHTYPNADGYPVVADCGNLTPYPRDAYHYVGRYGGGNIPRLAHQLLSGKTYDHKIHHCATFVRILLRHIGFRWSWPVAS